MAYVRRYDIVNKKVPKKYLVDPDSSALILKIKHGYNEKVKKRNVPLFNNRGKVVHKPKQSKRPQYIHATYFSKLKDARSYANDEYHAKGLKYKIEPTPKTVQKGYGWKKYRLRANGVLKDRKLRKDAQKRRRNKIKRNQQLAKR